SASVYSLAEAREKALAARRLVAERIDPIDHRARRAAAATLEKAKALTFKTCAEGYLGAHRAGWRNPKHRAQWESTLDSYVYPVLGELAVQVIDVGLVMRAIEPIWSQKPETASRVRGRVEAILDWATARGYRKGENPARWRGHLDKLLPKRSKVAPVEHHQALPYSELPSFIAELGQHEGVAARALEFTILTAGRTGEVIGARWVEFNIAERLWTVPPERMKGGREHRVPLSDAVLAILEKMAAIRQSDCVLRGGNANRPL